MTKEELAEKGREIVERFCSINNRPQPVIYPHVPKYIVGACGLFQPGRLYVDANRCANLGRYGAAWSWPGDIIDRTPYGVHCHELGHLVDHGWGWSLSGRLRRKTKEDKLTNYCPNDFEWFAEMFRLFLTNPDLLSLIRPRTYEAIREERISPVEERGWYEVLAGAPERTLEMAEKRIRQAKP